MNRNIIVVIPLFRSRSSLEDLYARLKSVLSSLTDQWEIILVDDASNDGTFDKMLEIRNRDTRVKLVRFVKNMGQHHATLCGMLSFKGTHVYLPAIMFSSVPPDRICNIPVDHKPRLIRKSTCSLRKLFKIASYLLINHSRIPLRLVTTWGFITSIGSLSFAFYIFSKVLLFGSNTVGWPSQAVLISFLSGNILFGIGILGEYIGRLVNENSTSSQFPVFEEHT